MLSVGLPSRTGVDLGPLNVQPRPAAAENLAHEILRPAVQGQERAPEILADQPGQHELHTGQHQHGNHQGRPALRRLVGDDGLDDGDGGSNRPQGTERQSEQGGEPERHYRKIQEHRQPQPDQPAHRVVGRTLVAWQMMNLQAADVLRHLKHQAVNIGKGALVTRHDALAYEGREAAEAREIEAGGLVEHDHVAVVGDNRKLVLSAIWNSKLPFDAHLPFFVMLASQGDYLEALDCLTIIENMSGPFDESQLLESQLLLKEYIEERAPQTEQKAQIMSEIAWFVKEQNEGIDADLLIDND